MPDHTPAALRLCRVRTERQAPLNDSLLSIVLRD